MADKFAITAELDIALASGIENKINALKEKLSKKNISLPIRFTNKDFNDQVKSIDTNLKKLLVTVDAVSSKFNKNSFNIDTSGVKKDVDKIKSEVKRLKSGVNNDILGKIGFDRASLLKDVEYVVAERSTVKKIFDRTIYGTILFNNAALRASIKDVYTELKGLKGSLSKPLQFSLDVSNKQELTNLVTTIKDIKSKTVSVAFNISEKSIEKVGLLKNSLTGLNSEISRLDLAKINLLSTGISTMARSLTTLAKLSGKKISFDLSVKDSKVAEGLAGVINRVAFAFEKAERNAINFRTSLVGVNGAISSLVSSLRGIDFTSINSASKSLSRLASKQVIGNQAALTTNVQKSTDAIYDLGVQSAITLKRFGAYTLVTAGFFRLSFAIRNAVSEFISFDKEITKVRQVTRQSVETTNELGDQVGELAIQYGVSSQSILNTSLILAQAGFTAKQTSEALEALTKTEVAPTFDSIENTVEGAVAAMAQFNIQTKDLDKTLSSINSVAAAFAVESEDITTAIQKAGGGFAAAGGSLEELQALFTSVRSTTRESADTIATGFRTIFTRLQRVRTGKFLQELGVEIRATAKDAKLLNLNEGDFVGPYEAIRRLSLAVKDLGSADPRFAQIVEELGGFRQINKVIPLLQQFGVAENALGIALGRTNSLTKDAEIAQESYANQLTKLKEEFILLIREFANDENVKSLISQMLQLARAGVQVAKTFKDIIPLIAAVGAIAGGRFIQKFAPGFKDTLLSRNSGGSIATSGGHIPGRGANKDTLVAALTKGEFVIQRNAVDKVGVGNLNLLNEHPELFANKGGPVGFNKGGVAGLAGVGGIAALSFSGILTEFNKFEDSIKGLISGIAGAALQFVLFSKLIQATGNKAKATSVDFSVLGKTSQKVESIISPSTSPTNAPKSRFSAFESNSTPSQFTAFDSVGKKTDSSITALTKFVKKSDSVVNKPKPPTFDLNKVPQDALYSMLPKDVRAAVEKSGVTRTTVNKLSDFDPKYATRQRGHPVGTTGDDSPGVFNKGTKTVVLKKDAKKVAETFFHEYGHAFDQTLGTVSNSKEFAKIRNIDLKNLPKDQRKKLSYYTQKGSVGREETFAQVFASITGNGGKTDKGFAKLFPESSKFVSKLIGPTEQDLLKTKIANNQKALGFLESRRTGSGQFGAFDIRNTSSNDKFSAFGQGQTLSRGSAGKFSAFNVPPNNFPNPPSGPGKFSAFGFGGPPNGPRGASSNNPPPRGPNRFSNLKSGLGKFGSKIGAKTLGVGLAASLVADVAGNFISDRSRPTKDKAGSKLGSQVGGALGTAGNFALTAGAAGFALGGPAGAVVAGALGGLAGAIYGATNAAKEFDGQVSRIEVAKITESLDKSFTALFKEDKTGIRNTGSSVVSNISSLQKILQSSDDKGTREDAFATLENNATNIQNFVNQTTKASTGLRDFSTKIPEATQRFIAGVLGIPFADFQKSIVNTIDEQTKQATALKTTNTSIQNFEAVVRSSVNFSSAFAQAAQSVNTFTANLESFISGGFGSASLNNNLSTNLSDLPTFSSLDGLSAKVLDFSNQFGISGEVLGKTVTDVIKVSNDLPNILLALRSSSPLGGADDITESFIKQLESAGIGKTVTDKLVANFENQLLGEDFKDSNFFEALNKDFPKVVADLISSISEPAGSLASSYAIVNEKLQQYSNGLSKVIEIDTQLVQGRSNIADLFGNLIQSQGTFSNKDVSNRLLSNENSRANSITGGLSINKLGANALSSRANINAIQGKIDATEDPRVRQSLLSAMAQEQSQLQRTTNALKFLADNTNKLSILQSKLQTEQSKRLTQKGFAESFLFGSISDQIKQQRVAGAAQNLASTGNISSVPQDIKGEVLSFLKDFAQVTIANGLNGQEVIDKALGNSGVSRGIINPGKEEQSIQQAIEAQIGSQIEAQQKLNDILANDRGQFFTQLNTDFAKFLTDLDTKLNASEIKSTSTQLGSALQQRASVTSQRDTLQRVNTRFGPDAIKNAQEIKKVNEEFGRIGSTPEVIKGLLSDDLSNKDNKFSKVANTKLKLFDKGERKGVFDSTVAIPKEEFDKEVFGSLLKNLRPDQINAVKSDLSKGDIGQNLGDNTVSVNKSFAVLQSSLERIAKETALELSQASETRDRLINNVGGAEKFSAIAKNVDADPNILKKRGEVSLIQLANDFPKNVSIETLNNELESLNTSVSSLEGELKVFRGLTPVPAKPKGFNSGGFVPGNGSGDIIPALLTPGEFVLNKGAVKKIGLSKAHSLNAQKFATGGSVSSGITINSESLNRFNASINQLAIQVQNMKDAFATIPTQINMVGNHKLDVYINGAQAFATMKTEFSNLITSEIKRGINKLLKTKFPTVGQFDG